MADFFVEISRGEQSFSYKFDDEVKFYADTFVYDNTDYFVISNGVNLSFNSINKQANIDFYLLAYRKKGETFFNDFRGSFNGLIYDKKLNRWIVYTNHFGDQKLFYAITNEKIIIGSNIFDIASKLKRKSLNTNAAYHILSYGYIDKDNTLLNEIKRLSGGAYLVLEDNKVHEKQYFTIDNTPNYGLSKADCVEGVDHYFRKAIQLEYSKDIHYGFKHIAAMSGGLDCRMTNWVANDMGFDNTVNLTYSQYGYLDMELSSAMSSYLKNEWIFSSLDNANYLREIDSITKVVNAQTAYSVSSQSFNFLKNVNFKRFGLMHSGQLGDVVIGTYSVEHAYDKPKSVKALSSKLLSKVQNDFSIYKNEETANFYLRGLNGILTDNFGYQKYTEITSPFLDVDFFNFCMAIPVKFRAYHGLYKEWIVQKYPDAATFKWEGINAKITDRSVRIRKKSVPVKGLLNFIIEGITYNLGLYSKMNTKKGMNPFDYWYRNDIRLRTHFEEYYKNHIDMITDKELKEDCSYLFKKGNTREKMQVLTILSAIKQFEV